MAQTGAQGGVLPGAGLLDPYPGQSGVAFGLKDGEIRGLKGGGRRQGGGGAIRNRKLRAIYLDISDAKVAGQGRAGVRRRCLCLVERNLSLGNAGASPFACEKRVSGGAHPPRRLALKPLGQRNALSGDVYRSSGR